MRRSDAHEVRQTYNAQAVVCAEGAQLVLATNLVATTADVPSFTATILGMAATIGLSRTVLANTGYASGPAVAALQARGIEPPVAIGRTQGQRIYDLRPPPPSRTPRRITEPWRLAMKTRLEQDDARDLYKQRKQSVEPQCSASSRAPSASGASIYAGSTMSPANGPSSHSPTTAGD